MKTFVGIIKCIVIIMLAIIVGTLIFKNSNQNYLNTGTNETNNTQKENKEPIDVENKNYIGEEENKEDNSENAMPDETTTIPDESSESNADAEQNTTSSEGQTTEPELTGKEKAVDIVKKQYATDGQTVKFNHMQGENYIIKVNDGTAVTWYIVDGATWEAEEY